MEKIKNWFNYKKLFLIIFSLTCSVLLFPNYFEATIYPVQDSVNELWKSLDPSWMIALNYASIKNLEWGNEIIFTYGPLSFLATRVGWGHDKLSFLFYDLFFFINFFSIIYFAFSKSKSFILPLLSCITAVLLFPVWLGSSNAFVLLAFLVFWVRLTISNPRIEFYVFQIITLCLAFFIKFNTGLIAFPIFFLGIIYQIIKDRNSYIKFILIGITPLFFIFILSFLLNVNILNYIKSGLELITGYNDIMYYEHDIKNKCLAIIVIFCIISPYLIRIFKRENKSFIKNTTLLLLSGIPLFVLFKQGFVRCLEIDFFLLAPFILLVTIDVYKEKLKSLITILLLVALITPIYYVFKTDKVALDIKPKLEMHYFEGFVNFTDSSGLHLFPNSNQLPNNILNKIGKNSIDVFPWNIQMLLENKLNYTPRPVIQSYTSYTKFLENKNFNFYNSSVTAPEYVIYDFASIDYRYAYFDEMKLQIVFKNNYEFIDYFDYKDRKLILLHKKSNFKPIKFVMQKEYAILINKPFKPKENSFYEFEVYHSIKGKMYSIFKHSPEINIEINANNNYPYIFRTSKELLKIGLFSNNYIENNSGYKNYLNSNSEIGVEKIKNYIFKPNSTSLFKEKIKVIEYKIK